MTRFYSYYLDEYRGKYRDNEGTAKLAEYADPDMLFAESGFKEELSIKGL